MDSDYYYNYDDYWPVVDRYGDGMDCKSIVIATN